MTANVVEMDHQPVAVSAFTGRRFEGIVPEDGEVFEVTSLGKGLTLDSERKVDLTNDLATKVLELVQVPYERKLRDTHVAYLINCMKRETFRPEMVRLTSCICEEAVHEQPKGTEFRMNGQHTCWAMIEMPNDYKCPGKIILAKYIAKTAQDMRLLYASIDRIAPRTRANVITAHLADTAQFKGLPLTVIEYLSQGYSFYKWPLINDRRKHDGDDTAYLMQSKDANLVNTVCAYLTTFSITNLGWLRRSPVIAAMFTTFDKAVKASGEFWDCVREGTGFIDKNDPRLRLRNALMTSRITKGQKQVTKRASEEEMFRWCISAWNAWRRGDTLTALRAVMNADRPKAK